MRSLVTAVLLIAWMSSAFADDPKWLVDARAKESRLIDARPVSSADKQLSFAVPVAMVGAMTEDKGSYSVQFAMGPDAVANCEILKDDVDVASLLRETARITFADSIEPAQGKVELKRVEHIDAGVAGPTAFLSAAWLYRVNDGKTLKVGALKQYAASRLGHGVYCALNDLGYAKSFATVAGALVESLKMKDAGATPHFSEVSVATVGDMRIGYSTVEMMRDKDGDTKSTETSALLMIIAPDALQSADLVHVEWVKPDGTVINAKHVMSNNGEIEMDLALAQGEGTSWLVDGTFKGKKVHENIADGVPSSWVSQTNLRRTLLAKESPIGAEATETDWLDSDPAHLTAMTVKVTSAIDANSFGVREAAGPMAVDMVVDRATGQATQGTMQVGPVAIKFARIYVQGTP